MSRFSLCILAALISAPVFQVQAGQAKATVRDPNEKVCQVITPVGSRLATKKVCATRAEWDDRKRQDREATERAQTQLCVVDPSTGKC